MGGSRRPDGTYRKPVRVRAGYTPIEENVYHGPEVQVRARQNGIPGYRDPSQLDPDDPPRAPALRPGFPPGYVPDDPKPKAKASSQKKEKAPKAKAAPKAAEPPPPPVQKAEPAAPAAPEKRLRNVAKKLAEIKSLEERANAEGTTLSPEQYEKISRKADLEAEFRELEASMKDLVLDDWEAVKSL